MLLLPRCNLLSTKQDNFHDCFVSFSSFWPSTLLLLSPRAWLWPGSAFQFCPPCRCGIWHAHYFCIQSHCSVHLCWGQDWCEKVGQLFSTLQLQGKNEHLSPWLLCILHCLEKSRQTNGNLICQALLQWLPMCAACRFMADKLRIMAQQKWANTSYSGFVEEHAYNSSWGKADKVGMWTETFATVGVLQWEYYSRQKDNISSVLIIFFCLP